MILGLNLLGCYWQVDDSMAFARDRRRRHPPGVPCISAGQSMGGLIATHLVLRDQDAWAGLILCSAAIDVEWTFVLRHALAQPVSCHEAAQTTSDMCMQV